GHAGTLQHRRVEYVADDVDTRHVLPLDHAHLFARISEQLVYFPSYFAESGDEERSSAAHGNGAENRGRLGEGAIVADELEDVARLDGHVGSAARFEAAARPFA